MFWQKEVEIKVVELEARLAKIEQKLRDQESQITALQNNLREKTEVFIPPGQGNMTRPGESYVSTGALIIGLIRHLGLVLVYKPGHYGFRKKEDK